MDRYGEKAGLTMNRSRPSNRGAKIGQLRCRRASIRFRSLRETHRESDDALADDYEQFPPQTSDTEPGRDNFLQGFMQGFGSQFSEVTGEVTHVVVDGEYVVVRGEYSATHTGEAFGIPATVSTRDESCFTATIDLHLVKDGQISKTWHLEDFMSIYNQLQAAAA